MEVDFRPLCDLALMLYGSALVSERYAGVADFLERGGDAGVKRCSNGLKDIGEDERVLPVTRKILNGAGIMAIRLCFYTQCCLLGRGWRVEGILSTCSTLAIVALTGIPTSGPTILVRASTLFHLSGCKTQPRRLIRSLTE